MYRLSWKTSSGAYRSKHFTSLAKMKRYAKFECIQFYDRLHYHAYNGKNFEPFVLIGGQVCTLSFLRSKIQSLTVEMPANAS